jgi:hypothetical protein
VATQTTLFGTTGNDLLRSPGSITTEVAGLQGNDSISLSLTGDETNAGAGNDSITLASSGVTTHVVSAGSGNDTLYTTTGQTQLRGSYNLNDGNDLFTNSANVQLVNVSIGGNGGSDTLTFGAAGLLNSTVGGGANADSIAITAGNVTNVGIIGGGGADTINMNAAGIVATLTTLQSADGHDRINATALVGSNTFIVGSGRGFDSIALGAIQAASIAGGAQGDTISWTSYAGGQIFGEGFGQTSAGAAGGADLIGTTAAAVTGAASIYGGALGDTIQLGAVSASGTLISGGNGADLIGNSGLAVGAATTAITFAGGNGQDTLRLLSLNTGTQVLGGAGLDSIYIGATGNGSVNGGAANDTINFSVPGLASQSAVGLATLNGGAGSDQFLAGSYTAGAFLSVAASNVSALSAVAGNLTVGSGDTIFFATTAAFAASNWSNNNQIQVLSAGTATVTGNALSGIVAYEVNGGNDLILGIVGAGTGTAIQLLNLVGGAGLMTTTIGGASAGGNLVINASNFGFTVSGTLGTGVTISIT